MSSIAIYKTKNDHGNGFYNLCEELGIGSAKKLKRNFFGFTELENCKQFWKNQDNYDLYFTINQKKKHPIDFFKKEEIEFLSNWQGKIYDKNNPEHVSAKNYIMESLGSKVKYWSNELIKRLPQYDTFNWRMWSQKGWTEKKEGEKQKQVARFKSYTWARIFKKGDDNKDVFFTVSADAGTKELVYKMDYYYENNSHLSQEQKNVIESNIPEEAKWFGISINEIENYNWDKLLEISSKFIADYTNIYDSLIELAWGENTPDQIFTNTLRKRNRPIDGLDTPPIPNPNFNGIEKDYIEEAKQNKELGDAGEQLVIQFEKKKLTELGLTDLADKVKKVKDGEGYDILSFDRNRVNKFIEVKTTTYKENTPFFISLNERIFAERNQDKYFI